MGYVYGEYKCAKIYGMILWYEEKKRKIEHRTLMLRMMDKSVCNFNRIGKSFINICLLYFAQCWILF